MNILHVTIGDPKTHQGGLSRYCLDLVNAERALGSNVFVLYPGSFQNSKKPRIQKKGNGEYIVRDALPVPLNYGVGSPERYMVSSRRNNFLVWLSNHHINLIHVHSIQGIHYEFFVAAKLLNIPIVFTTHDFYSFCFRCSLLDQDGLLCSGPDPDKCLKCNRGAGIGLETQRILQSSFYQRIKTMGIVQKLSKNIQKHLSGTKKSDNSNLTPASSEKSYASLLKYYSDIFFTFDCVFANSFKTQTLFQAHFPDANYRVLTLTHAGISRQFHVRSDTSHLNIGYMGGSSEYKGYSTLLGAIKLLEEAGFREENWTVYMFGGNFPAQLDDKHLKYMGWFDDEKENSVWDSVDLLIVPSQCFETFGFVVLESLSNGIPVICSDLVGASALAQSIDPCMVFQHNDKNDLCQKMQIFFKIENYLLIKKEIDAAKIQTDMYKHAEEVISAYEDVVRWNIKKT